MAEIQLCSDITKETCPLFFKILILVCPYIEAAIGYLAKMNLNRTFALAGEIIHDHENGSFSKNFYLVMKTLSQLSHLCRFIKIMSNHLRNECSRSYGLQWVACKVNEPQRGSCKLC